MIAWADAHPAATAWLCALVFLAGCAGLVVLGIRLVRHAGRHSGRVTARDEETADLFAAMSRPPEIAREPPAEFFAAPLAALPVPAAACDLPDWAAQEGDALAEAQAAPFERWESDTFVGGIPVELDEHGLVKPAFADADGAS